MALPRKTANREDRLFLDRAMRALDDAKQSLKEFSKKSSVSNNVRLSTSVQQARDKLKKTRKRVQAISVEWDTPSSDP